jgi:RNA polymerase sigma factor FliA
VLSAHPGKDRGAGCCFPSTNGPARVTEVVMATLCVPTSLPLGSPAAVPILDRGPTSRRPTSRPSVRAKDLWDDERLQTKQNLIVEMLPIVKRLAFKIRQHLPSHVEVDDLVANGVLGLIDAIRKFDAGKRVKFESYARHRIHGAILDGLRSADPISRDIRRKHKKIQKVYRDLEAKLGRPIRDEEMAAALGMELAQWHQALNAIQAAGPDFAERLLTAAPPFTQLSADPALLADDSSTAAPSPFDLCFRRERRDILCRAVSCLREREQQVISLYYEEELTMKQIAERLDVDESRVSQIHSAALTRLRMSIGSYYTHVAYRKPRD